MQSLVEKFKLLKNINEHMFAAHLISGLHKATGDKCQRAGDCVYVMW